MHCWIIIRDFCGWMKNLQRCAEQGQKYHKSVTTVFPGLTKDIFKNRSGGINQCNAGWPQYRIPWSAFILILWQKDSAICWRPVCGDSIVPFICLAWTELNRYIRRTEQKLVETSHIDNYGSVEQYRGCEAFPFDRADRRSISIYWDAAVRKIEKRQIFCCIQIPSI